MLALRSAPAARSARGAAELASDLFQRVDQIGVGSRAWLRRNEDVDALGATTTGSATPPRRPQRPRPARARRPIGRDVGDPRELAVSANDPPPDPAVRTVRAAPAEHREESGSSRYQMSVAPARGCVEERGRRGHRPSEALAHVGHREAKRSSTVAACGRGRHPLEPMHQVRPGAEIARDARGTASASSRACAHGRALRSV